MGLVGGQNCCRRKISRRATRVWEWPIIFVISLLLLLLLLLLTSLVTTALITLMSQPTDNSHSNHSAPIVKNTMLFNQISALATAHLFRNVPQALVDRVSEKTLAYQKILVLVHKVFPNRGDHNFHPVLEL